MIKKIFLYIDTLRYLKASQIYFRIYRNFFKPSVSHNFIKNKPQRPKNWLPISLYKEKIDKNNFADFINLKVKLALPEIWKKNNNQKLWRYNLHYFEDVISENYQKKHSKHLDLFDNWIANNPIGKGDGWEPYPLSLRICSLLKGWLNGLPLRDRHFKSLFNQASFLSNSLEKHLLGNHYFANLKALLFSGVIFENKEWVDIAAKNLLIELPEQILEDGGHFELSPMYHLIILVDMLDIYNLLNAYPKLKKKRLRGLIKNKIPKMLKFSSLLSHNDHGVSFFNDSVDGIAPETLKIFNYAKKLGFVTTSTKLKKDFYQDLNNTGFMVVSYSDKKLIFDSGNVGPNYIPGHAHADTLSVELSLGKQRFIVNSGVSSYEIGHQREYERSTRAHSTVEINESNSSQVWSSFRVAKRAKVIDRSIVKNKNYTILSASHDGYSKFLYECIHTRKIKFSEKIITISDIINGEFSKAVSRLYFHPKIKLSRSDNELSFSDEFYEMKIDLSDKEYNLTEANYYPKFNTMIPNICLEVEMKNRRLDLCFMIFKKSQ